MSYATAQTGHQLGGTGVRVTSCRLSGGSQVIWLRFLALLQRAEDIEEDTLSVVRSLLRTEHKKTCWTVR